ncbi:putative nucleoporin Nup54/Nup57/Nup44 [Helianthus annuus]|uniref:Nucleoporin Nup54/Nup57/Nup44 n=1 Tax=Helianthus annuus TaxID=4232 RepID=A0A251V668_HELAN|nr:putative nucleoporin Nup54/Nup57/Nup44 [Helianthus annuus]KAJ0592370.1 putative nucleoporin [Helianthus annuus]KAJ0599901.1 putative nucleoporin [Helianthus annuus]KAJ0607356.1 putative nucleoporin [Helianthus annuus]KAJ0767411.1 putative nucleoporin [Helianthus annuus]
MVRVPTGITTKLMAVLFQLSEATEIIRFKRLAILDAYKDEVTNPKYAFKHLLFSVTEPQFRAKPAGVSDITWAEAMGKLEGMEASNRERLWPQLVKGFNDLSECLKVHHSTRWPRVEEDETIISK